MRQKVTEGTLALQKKPNWACYIRRKVRQKVREGTLLLQKEAAWAYLKVKGHRKYNWFAKGAANLGLFWASSGSAMSRTVTAAAADTCGQRCTMTSLTHPMRS